MNVLLLLLVEFLDNVCHVTEDVRCKDDSVPVGMRWGEQRSSSVILKRADRVAGERTKQ